MEHFNWFGLAVSHDYLHVATGLLSSCVAILIAYLARERLVRAGKDESPSGVISIKSFFEGVVTFVSALCEMVIGAEGKKFVGIFVSLFFFILVYNLVGLIPGMTPATENLNTTVALGVFSFAVYNFYGFKEHGISYLKQFMGPLLVLAPLMVIIELISHFVRPMSLGLRLYGNMVGDHTVLGIFLNLTPYVIPVLFYCLGIFVCFMQAFIFTMLSIIYVSMAISHDH